MTLKFFYFLSLFFIIFNTSIYSNECPKYFPMQMQDGLVAVLPIYDATIVEPDMDCDGLIDTIDSDIDGDGFSNIDEKNHGTNPLNSNSKPNDLLIISNDDNGISSLHASKVQFFPKNTYGINQENHGMWPQGITHMDNGFYLMSLKEINAMDTLVEKYIFFHLYDTHGKSIGNVKVDYPSHGQDLSIEKISENEYYLYSSGRKRDKIARFKFDTSNIDFNALYHDDIPLKLNIEFNKTINLKSNAASVTPSISEDKSKIASVGDINEAVLKININDNDKLNFNVLKSFTFDINPEGDGYINQGIAMFGEKIFLLRGHVKATGEKSDKKIFVFDAKNGKLLTSYTFSLENNTEFYKIEPEGLMIQNNELFVCLPTINNNDNKTKKIRLYKLLDIK